MAICTLGACGKTVSKTEAKSAEAEKVVEENDSTKQTEEVDDSPIVTQMALGFDTLIVKGKSRRLNKDYALKDYAKCL